MWKPHLNPNEYNGRMFMDGRHLFKDDKFKEVTDFLTTITKQEVEGPREIFTNVFQMNPDPFNDYENNYWMPHLDEGYNGIIYLNNIPPHAGTNIYKSHNDMDAFNVQEHEEPWRPKNKWELETVITAKFNRCVLFDGKKLLHGMSVVDDTFVNIWDAGFRHPFFCHVPFQSIHRTTRIVILSRCWGRESHLLCLR